MLTLFPELQEDLDQLESTCSSPERRNQVAMKNQDCKLGESQSKGKVCSIVS
jgi:hypothetical protein